MSKWLPVLLWSALIFLASSNPDPNKSLPPRWTEPCLTTLPASQSCAELLGRFLHVTEYAILAALTARAMIGKEAIEISRLFLILGLIMVYALSDEVHQWFVLGRSFQLLDLGFDLLGALIGLFILSIHARNSPSKDII